MIWVAATITWYHSTQYKADDQGVCWAQLSWPASGPPKQYGGWAEPNSQYGYYAPHYSCTPTSATNHESDNVQMVGSFASYDAPTDTVYMNLGFTCPSGGTIRVHLWTIT